MAGAIVPAMLRLALPAVAVPAGVALAPVVFRAITVSATFVGGRARRPAIRSAVQPVPAE